MASENEASHWVDMKRHLPDQVQQMTRDYQTIHAFDFAPIAATVQRASGLAGKRRPDLDSPAWQPLHEFKRAASRRLWQSSAELRRIRPRPMAYSHLNFGALGGDEDALRIRQPAGLPQRSASLTALTGQLYTSWVKILADMEERGHGKSKTYDQQIRTVTTQVPDAASKAGATKSEDRWVEEPKPTYDAMRNDLGMAIEHKGAGKYDTEAEHVTQPCGVRLHEAAGTVEPIRLLGP